MYISPINSSYATQNNNHKQISFRKLIVDKSASSIIKNMSEKDTVEFKKIKKRLSKTKFWDMKISNIGHNFEEFHFEFIEKKNNSGIITNGIYPYNKKDNTIQVYSIIYGPKNITENIIKTLRYESKERADSIYAKYSQNLEESRLKNYQLTPIETLKNKEFELNMLEEASCYAPKNDKYDKVNTKIKTKNVIGNNLK